MRNKLIGNTKIDIKKMLWESRHIPDQESRAPPENKEVIGYMDLEV